MSVVICGHVDSGTSTTTGRLLFELGGLPEREMQKVFAVVAFFAAAADAFAPVMRPAMRSAVAASSVAAPKMALEVSAVEQLSSTLAGVVAVDGGTIGLEVSFAAFLAVILGLFIPVVFLVTLFIQSDAQGTATTFRQPDSIGGTRYEDE